MKLHEITSSQNLILNEILDTKIPIEKWATINDAEIGTLNIDEDEYRIIFEKFDYDVNGEIKKGLNIAFEKQEQSGGYSQKLTMDNASASKVLGAIYNACIVKLRNTTYDAIILVAVDNLEQRMRIYNVMARRLIKILPNYSYIPDIKIPNGILTIVCNDDKWTPEEMDELKARASK